MKTDQTILAETGVQFTPVILAGGKNLDQWPLSRADLPVQFLKDKRSESRFELALKNLCSLPGAGKPVIVVPAAELETAKSQIRNVLEDRPIILIVEPVDRGSFNTLFVATEIIKGAGMNQMLVTFDAALPNADWDKIRCAVGQTLKDPVAVGQVVTFGHPVAAEQVLSQRDICKGERTSSNLLWRCSPLDEPCERGRFRFGAVVVSHAQSLTNWAQETVPLLRNSNPRTIREQKSSVGSIWPDLNIYSSLEYADLFSALSKSSNCGILFRPVELSKTDGGPSVQSHILEESTRTTVHGKDHLVVVQGCDDLEIVTTKDVTVIMSRNRPSCQNRLIERLETEHRPELYQTLHQHFLWGSRCEIERNNEFIVDRLEIAPGQTLPHDSTAGERINWVVLSGTGVAMTAKNQVYLYPVPTFPIAANGVEKCTNTGTSPLVILESRTCRN